MRKVGFHSTVPQVISYTRAMVTRWSCRLPRPTAVEPFPGGASGVSEPSSPCSKHRDLSEEASKTKMLSHPEFSVITKAWSSRPFSFKPGWQEDL